MLRTVEINECSGAPHEFRGVYRGGLLKALHAGVPDDRIQYNSAVQSLMQDDVGVALLAAYIRTPFLFLSVP